MGEREPFLSHSERVREADADAEAAWKSLYGTESPDVITAFALIAIAAELRAQRIARGPGAGQ